MAVNLQLPKLSGIQWNR